VSETATGKVVLSASMSLDGFMAGPEVGVEHPMGMGGERLHEWLFDETDGGRADAELAAAMSAAVGAVVIGRQTFDVGLDPWGDVPIETIESPRVTHLRFRVAR